jgi:hypothetical protein
LHCLLVAISFYVFHSVSLGFLVPLRTLRQSTGVKGKMKNITTSHNDRFFFKSQVRNETLNTRKKEELRAAKYKHTKKKKVTKINKNRLIPLMCDVQLRE